jgi:2',3'-cyclic-nucleotide 2'-phosphodiesterase (5'-nucleotidase family)
LARRATFFNQVWDQGVTTLVLDAGDLFGNRNARDMATSEFLAEQTMRFGYDAIGLGERDLNYGYAFLRRMIDEHGLPFTSANVRNAETGELILPEFLIVERGGLRFGICSVMDPAHRIVSMATRDIQYEVADPVETLRALVPRLRQQCDTVVLLSHLGDRLTEQVLNEVGGIDIAVVGHVYRSLTQERIMNDAIVLAAVPEGRVIGRANLSLSRQTGQVATVQVAITTLDATVADDPVMLGAVQQFLRDVENRREDQRAQFPRNLGSLNESFLGENNCSACHSDIHQQWRQTSHARSFGSLRATAAQFEPECLACHTTGYRHHHGYDEQHRTNLVQVQCEACHGYGTAHRRDGTMLKLARESCTQCHIANRPCYDELRGQDFDYARYWERIAH